MRDRSRMQIWRSWLCCALLLACGGAENPAEQEPSVRQVPRDRTLILGLTQMLDYDAFNPFIPGVVSSTGSNFLFEPLYYYNAYGKENNLIPWIAESHQYNDDYTAVTVKNRIPHNETYWKNWPTAENPYVNSAYWHRTWLLVLLNLEPA